MIVPQKSAQRIAASHWLVVVRFVDPTQQQQVVSYLSDLALYDSAQYSPSSPAAAWRKANAGRVSLEQLKVMSAIESCRTAALGGHVALCEKCAHIHVAYNSCRNRHCPKCQGSAAREWLAERQAELLPVPLCSVQAYVLI